jgi:hypothetical protein
MAEHRTFPHTIYPPSRNARDPAKVQPSAQYQSRCGLLSQTGLVPGPQPQYCLGYSFTTNRTTRHVVHGYWYNLARGEPGPWIGFWVIPFCYSWSGTHRSCVKSGIYLLGRIPCVILPGEAPYTFPSLSSPPLLFLSSS